MAEAVTGATTTIQLDLDATAGTVRRGETGNRI